MARLVHEAVDGHIVAQGAVQKLGQLGKLLPVLGAAFGKTVGLGAVLGNQADAVGVDEHVEITVGVELGLTSVGEGEIVDFEPFAVLAGQTEVDGFQIPQFEAERAVVGVELCLDEEFLGAISRDDVNTIEHTCLLWHMNPKGIVKIM